MAPDSVDQNPVVYEMPFLTQHQLSRQTKELQTKAESISLRSTSHVQASKTNQAAITH